MPDLEVHTLLPEGEVGRGDVANEAFVAFRDDDDLGGGVWGEYFDGGDVGGGGGGMRLGEA